METKYADTERLMSRIADKFPTDDAVALLSNFETERQTGAILDSLFEHVVYQSPDLRICWANRSASESVGAPCTQLIGRHCYEVWGGSDQPCPDCPVLKAMQTGDPQEIEKDTPDGRSWQIKGYAVRDNTGRVVGGVEVTLEITEKRRAQQAHEKLERQLIQLQKMEAIGTLAGGIAHDFNNILFPIIGYTEMILSKVGPGTNEHAQLQEVLKSATRARELVRQILTFSRQNDSERKQLKIQPILKESLKMLRSVIPSTVTINQSISDEGGYLVCNAIQIHQIMMNLCTNALHAMREKNGRLDVGLTEMEIKEGDLVSALCIKKGRYIRLAVADNGHGMKPETVSKIFDPYFTTKAEGEGTGLGLSVVHGIVRKHGGYVSVYSEPEKGTTFHIYLPCAESDGIASEDGSANLQPEGSERILLVDDEIDVVRTFQLMLEDLGYTVVSFTNSVEAMDRLLAEPDDFDLVITDYTMPNMTGSQFAKMIRMVLPQMPVILCTGFSESLSQNEASALGIRKVIMKPLIRSEIAQTLRNVLDGK